MAMSLRENMSPLLTKNLVDELKQQGVYTVVQLVCSPPELVARGSGQPLSWAKQLQLDLLGRFAPHAVSGRTLLMEAEENLCIFPFGCNSVDNLLQGGVFTSELTELWGAAASGKTQLCMCLAGQAVSRSPFSVCYVDGNAGGFNSSQLQQYLSCQGGGKDMEDLSALMDRVRVFRVFSVFELLSLLHSIHYHISHRTNSFYSNLRLLIIDPVTLYLAPHLTAQQSQAQMLMLELAKAMAALSQDHSIAVLYCNNVVAARGGGLKPALGQTWSPSPTTRLHLTISCLQGDSTVQRFLTISKSPRQVTGRCAEFQLDPVKIIN